MVTAARSRAKDVFEALVDQELTDNTEGMGKGNQPLLTPQEEKHLRAENARACVDSSALLENELKGIARLACTIFILVWDIDSSVFRG